MFCQMCRSENIRKFDIVYEEGTSHGSSSGSHGISVGHFNQTPLAARCSPPSAPRIGCLLAIVGCFAAFSGAPLALKIVTAVLPPQTHYAWLILVVTYVAGFFLTLFVFQQLWRRVLAKNSWSRYYLALNNWHHSWICMKCGHAFIVH